MTDSHVHLQKRTVQFEKVYNNHQVQLPDHFKTEGQGPPQQGWASTDSPKQQHLPAKPCTETSSSTTHSTIQGSFLHVMFGLRTVTCKIFSSPLEICGHLEATAQETPSRGQDKHNHSRTAPAVQEHPKHCRGHKRLSAVLDLRHSYLLHKLYYKLFSQRNFTESFFPPNHPAINQMTFRSSACKLLAIVVLPLIHPPRAIFSSNLVFNYYRSTQCILPPPPRTWAHMCCLHNSPRSTSAASFQDPARGAGHGAQHALPTGLCPTQLPRSRAKPWPSSTLGFIAAVASPPQADPDHLAES